MRIKIRVAKKIAKEVEGVNPNDIVFMLTSGKKIVPFAIEPKDINNLEYLEQIFNKAFEAIKHDK